MRKVELMDAFAWACGSCGKMNYVHAVADYISEEQFNEEFNACTPEGTGAFIERPPTLVVCPLCKESFQTTLEEMEELDE